VKEDSVLKRALQLLLAAWLTTATLWAAGDPFVGKWKLDPSRSKETDQMKIEAAGPNKYVLDFGPGGSPPFAPESAHKTEMIVADGTEQPGHAGTTLSVTPVEPNTWRLVRKKDGYTVMTAIFKLSADAKTPQRQLHGLPARWVDIQHRLRVHANGGEFRFRGRLGKFEREGKFGLRT
jgi:hypothetical protein